MQTKEILINPAYAELLRRKERILRLQGGAGSGKSIAVAQMCLALTMQRKYSRIFAFRKVGRTVKDSVFLGFQDLISEAGLEKRFAINKSHYTITDRTTGNIILCGGMDDPEKVKSIKDPTLIWMEEATEFSLNDFSQLNLRLRKAGARNQIILSYNPINDQNWIYKTFELENNYEQFFLKTTYKDNFFLPLPYRQELERLVTRDQNYYNVYTLGEWGTVVKGLIFPNFEIIDTLPDGERIHGLDFGYNDPMALVTVVIGTNELFIDCPYYEREKVIPQLIERFPAMGIHRNSRIYADSARPGDIQQVFNSGYHLIKPSIKGAGSIASGINKLKEYKIFVTSRSVELIRELQRYKWEEDKEGNTVEGVPVDAFNHAIDALRYAVYTHTFKPVGPVNAHAAKLQKPKMILK